MSAARARTPAATAEPVKIEPYRTLTLDQIAGNEPIRKYLRRAWSTQTLPQALLLVGPAGIGKTCLAYALMREIVAEGEDPATAPRAKKIERGVHPDILELTGKTSASSMILVDEIRDMEDRIWRAPLESPRRIVLIEPAHKMNTSAANCLLKLLEEPPRSVLFILISSEPNQLLDTIRSRCTILSLEPVPREELAAWLVRERDAEADEAEMLATLAEGRPGFAESLKVQGGLERRGKLLGAMARLPQFGFAAVFGIAELFCAGREPLLVSFSIATTLLRDALIMKMGGGRPVNSDLTDSLASFAGQCSAAGLLAAAEEFDRASADVPFLYSPQAQTHFMEVLLCRVGKALKT